MARKKSKNDSTEETTTTKNENPATTTSRPEEETIEEEEIVYLQVDTGDIVKVKQVLDEAVAGTFLEDNFLGITQGNNTITASKSKCIGLSEDHKWNNIKLVLMAVACAFAMLAQFSPVPFPENRPILGICCTIYFILSGILQLITTFYDQDCILITKPMKKEQTSDTAKNPNLVKYGLRVRTNMPRFSEYYTVIIEFQGLENSPFVKKTWSVGKFFDVEGMFDEFGLEDEVEQLFRRFEAGKFDTEDDSKEKKS
jgi:signal peptidase complex subunit 2